MFVYLAPFIIFLIGLVIIFQYVNKLKIIRNGLVLGFFSLIFYVGFIFSNSHLLFLIYSNNFSPFFEEVLKFLAIYLYPFGGDYEDKEFYAFGASLGLTISFIENLLTSGSFFILFYSSIFVTFLHVITSIISAHLVLNSKKQDNNLLLFYIIIPILIHYFYNMIIGEIMVILFS